MKSLSRPGSHRRAVREPAAGRKPAYPAQMTAAKESGSQSREPMPADSPRTLRDGRGESAGGGSRRLPQTGPDTDSCLGVKGHGLDYKVCRPSRSVLRAGIFTLFHPADAAVAVRPGDRAGPAACVRIMCWYPSVPPAWPSCARRGWGRSRSSAAKCRRCDRVLDPFGQPLPGTGPARPRLLRGAMPGGPRCSAAVRLAGAAFRAGCHSACTSPRC